MEFIVDNYYLVKGEQRPVKKNNHFASLLYTIRILQFENDGFADFGAQVETIIQKILDFMFSKIEANGVTDGSIYYGVKGRFQDTQNQGEIMPFVPLGQFKRRHKEAD